MTIYLASIRGTIASAALSEIFVHTFAIISSAPQADVASALAAKWDACLKTATPYALRQMFYAAVIYNEVTVAQILNEEPPDPRLAKATHVAFGPTAGAAGSPMLPSQLAVAVSMEAGTKANGVPRKGRFYLPTPATSVLDSTTGLLTTTATNNIRDQIASFWAQMNLAGHQPALWSRTAGTVVPWDRIRVGNRVDTIRRRRNELPETYSQFVTVVSGAEEPETP